LKHPVKAMLAQARSWFRRDDPDPPTRQLTIAEQKALLTTLLVERPAEPAKFIASFSQQSLWLVNQLQPKSAAYNLQVGLRLRGHLDRNAIERGLREIVDRHGTLRTKFELDETQLSQIVLPSCPVVLPLTDLGHFDESRRYAEAYALAAGQTQIPFDLSQVPLFRFTLIRLAPEDHILTFVMDHIISDGWSMGLFIQELTVLYESFSTGRESPLTPLPVQYGDYASWQREWVTGQLLDTQIAYWKKKLSGAPPVLQLASGCVRPATQTNEGASQFLALSQQLVRDLQQLAVRHNATLFMIAFAAFTVLLFRYNRQEDLLIGVPVAGRSRMETETLIGFFVNMLVLRTNLRGDPPFCDLLAQVREVAIEAFCNADIPFVQLVEALNPVRSVSYHPIFQVVFAFVRAAARSDRFGALEASPYVVKNRTARFDLTMNLIEGANDQWTVELEYSTALFNHEGITTMLGLYHSFLRTIVANPHLPLSGFLSEGAVG